MFNTLGVAIYCLLGACPVFVAGTGSEMSSPHHDELRLQGGGGGVIASLWCTTWLVPGNSFAPLGLNSNYDIHSATRLISN